MKLRNKITLISAATLMALSPAATVLSNNPSVVQAAKVSKKTITTNQFDNFRYNGNGKELSGFVKKNTTLPRLSGLVTIKGKKYYRVGKNTYVRADAVAKIDNKNTLLLDYNSYVYNNKGKRVKVPTLKKNLPILFYNTKTIKGKKYYRIGKNQYVKAANVGVVNGKIQYVDETYVTVKADKTHSYTKDGYANDTQYKKGQKVRVDQFIYTPASGSDDFAAFNDDSAVPFYRIKGEKDAYLSSLDVTPRKAMKAVNYDDLHYTFAEYTQPADMPIYTINGTPSDVVVPHAATNAERRINVDRLMYIWVPSEKKAELFYHISSQYVMAPEGDVYTIGKAHKFVGDGFVKQSDVKVSGLELKPVNTPEEAEQDSKTATISDKQALQNEIDKHTDVEKSDAYRLTSRNKREAYDTQLKLAQDVEKSNTSTIAAVKLAVWSLQQKTNDLDGAKVHVKNVNQLTEAEARKVYRVAYNANDVYTPQYNYLITIRFSDHNRRLSMNVRHYSKATQDPKFLVSSTDTELKISDYATDK